MFFRVNLVLLLVASLAQSQYKNVKLNTIDDWSCEVTIAVNPTNPSNIVAGANLKNTFYTFDKGESWVNDTISSTFNVWGDPCVIFDMLSNVYYFHLSFPTRPDRSGWIDRIVCQKSTDGGKNWAEGTYTGLNLPKKQDKQWGCSDWTNSKWKNNVYVSWTQFDKYGSRDPEDSSNIMFSRSTDSGISWSNAIRINEIAGDCKDSSDTVEGAVPCVGPDGQVYVAWAGPAGLIFTKSVDGGLTFSRNIKTTEIAWDYDIEGLNRCNGMPIACCDISSSIYKGNIYISFSDQRNGKTNTDILLVKSTDGGGDWSKPMKIKQQFMSWMSVDPVTGSIYILFYDRRNYNDLNTDVYLAVSTNGGSNFKNTRISESPFIPVSTVFFGDYTGVSAYNNFAACIWQRIDNGKLSVIFCGVTL
jgi:hypothetical protein